MAWYLPVCYALLELAMRKVILGAGISLDGYVARPDGGIDFLYQPKGYSMAAFFAMLDAVVLGRKTFDEAVKRAGGSYKPQAKMPTYVFSKSQPAGQRGGVIFVNQPPAAFVKQLRKRVGKHIYVMGGGELARSFLIDDVVDELYLGVYPVLLGGGIPFFPSGFPQRDFKLTASKTYEPGGFLELTYARVRATPPSKPSSDRPAKRGGRAHMRPGSRRSA
jgi:dihydrofolate reductase